MLQCAQRGTIEFHVWAARADAVERPERMIIDLDPDEGLDFTDVKRAALDIRGQLADLGLVSYALLSGGEGIHFVVPYSARARRGAPAAGLIAWRELDDFSDAHPFTIDDAEVLIGRAASPALRQWGFAAQRLPSA